MLPRRVVSTALISVTLACSSDAKRPPQIGDCNGEPNAPCGDPTVAGGSSSPTDAATTSVVDSGGASVLGDGGSCGTADTMLMSPCAPCIVQTCCMADTACSADSGCLALLQCAVAGQTGCQALSIASAQAYSDLTECMQLTCPVQCESVLRTPEGDP